MQPNQIPSSVLPPLSVDHAICVKMRGAVAFRNLFVSQNTELHNGATVDFLKSVLHRVLGFCGWAKKRAKNSKNGFLALFWAYIGQPDDHIGWATLMPHCESWSNWKKQPCHGPPRQNTPTRLILSSSLRHLILQACRKRGGWGDSNF